jgi:hypothetical protein
LPLARAPLNNTVKLHMERPAHFFEIQSAEQLFALLKVIADRFTQEPAKRVEDLLLLVFGLTHLREWIAPGYSPTHVPISPEQNFYQNILTLEEFRILQGLCNRSKHMSLTTGSMGASHEPPIDDWRDGDSVSIFGRGPTIAYCVEGYDVDDVIRVVVAFYQEHWFQWTRDR